MASGVMYLRISALLGLFNRGLLIELGPSFVLLAGIAFIVGWLWSRRPDANSHETERPFEPRNPLELRAAFFFGFLFLTMLIATRFAAMYLGRAGVYGLAAIMGVADVDPFILGMTQSAGAMTNLSVAAAAIAIAAASNNLVKGIYAYVWSDRATRLQSLALLGVFAALGLVPLVWLR